jgi:hypothetical protein
MSFLKRFFLNVLHENTKRPAVESCFDRLSPEELESHLGVAQYGDFHLTDAVRPAFDLRVVPQQGFRHDAYHDEANNTKVPVIMAAASREDLFELFMESLDPLGFEVDVVLETSHNQRRGSHRDLYRDHIDMPVLKSVLWDFEDLLVNDGCTGIAVLNPEVPQEVQFDEHKLLIMYGDPLDGFEEVLQARGLDCREDLRFITEAEHVHSSTDDYCRQFEELKLRLGMDEDFD